MRTRRLLAALAGAGAAVLAWAVLPVVAVELDEGGVPTNRQAHLPRDVDVLAADESCGSGGCWRALTLAWPGHSSGELERRLGLGDDGQTETCRAVSVLDRRRVCLGTGSVVEPSAVPGQLTVQLRWRRPLRL